MALSFDVGPYPILVRGRSVARMVSVHSLSDGSSAAIGNGGTVTLYTMSGTSLVSGTTSGGGVTYTVPAGSDVGPAYELWDVTAGSTPIKVRVPVLLVQADLLCPINNDAITQRILALDEPPVGEDGWFKAISRGWDRLIRDMVRLSRVGVDAEIWSAGAVYDAALAACMAQVLETAAAYGSATWEAARDRWETRYQHELQRMMVDYGTDNDAGVDTDRTRLSRGSGIGEVPTGRVG